MRLISFCPDYFYAGGHGPVYQQCLYQACTALGWEYIALLPRKTVLTSLPTPKQFCLHRSCVLRWIDYVQALRRRDKKSVFFIESFNIKEFFILISSALFFLSRDDTLCLLFRRGWPRSLIKQKATVAIFWLQKKLRGKVIFLTDSEMIANQYRHSLAHCRISVMPVPHTFFEMPPAIDEGILYCWWPGEPRAAKGLGEIRHLSSRADPSKVCIVASRVAGLDNVVFTDAVISQEEYIALMIRTHIVLLPYAADTYRESTSGIFIETVAAGRLPLVKAGTWLAEELQRFDLNELIVDWFDPHFFQRARTLLHAKIVQEKLHRMSCAYRQWHCQKRFVEELYTALT